MHRHRHGHGHRRRHIDVRVHVHVHIHTVYIYTYIVYIYICIYTYMYILHTPYSQLYVGGSHHGLYVPVRTYWCFSRHVAANLLIEMENHCSTCVKPVALCCPAHRLLSSHLPPVRHADFEGQWIEMGCVTKCCWFDRPNYGISPMNMT